MKVASFYPKEHPSVRVAVQRALSTLGSSLATASEVEFGFGEAGILYAGDYLPDPDRGLHAFATFLLDRGVARLVFRRGLDFDTLGDFLRLLASDPAGIVQDGGFAGYLSSRNISTIQVGEIDLEKIFASETDASRDGTPGAGGEKEAWKRLIADFLRGSDDAPSDGMKAFFRNLATDGQKLLEVTQHLSEGNSRDLPRLIGRLSEEVLREAGDSMETLASNLGEVLLKLEARTRMDLLLSKIPLSDGTADLTEEVIRRLADPQAVELVSSLVEVEGQLSPRLFSICSKIFTARGKSAPYFGPVTAQLQQRPQGSELKRIWQSLQGLLVESDHDYLSETYRATLESIAQKVEPVGPDLRSALQTSPGFPEAFDAEAISDHTCRVILGALDNEPETARIESLREDLDRRAKKMTGRRRLPLLGELIRGLAEPRPGDVKGAGRASMDRRVRSAVEQMVRVFRSEYERLTEEERAAAGRAFQELGGIAAPALVEGLAEEGSWEVRRGLLAILSSLGRAAVPVLLKRLNDPSWFLVRNAALLLGEIGGATLVEPVAALLRHEEPRVRREAAAALGKIGGPRAVVYLREALLDPEVSAVASRVLGEVDRENTVTLFSRRLARAGPLLFDDGAVREAITILGEMQAKEAVPALRRILARGFWIPFSAGDLVRVQAAQALHRIGTREAQAAIREAAGSSRRLVRDTCVPLTGASPTADRPGPTEDGASR